MPHAQVDFAKIEKVIREYIQRMVELMETLQGVSTDSQIDCPKCGAGRNMISQGQNWRCLDSECDYEFPTSMNPPSPDELEEYITEKKKKARQEQITKLFDQLDIKI